ncbi:MAG TPA: dihydrofolate reductase family protein [Solirubrobacterales bacterium]|nr:dihydrofolate reductase family protein [Solirubrobacterales bacterium]
MGKVTCDISISLDGYAAGPDQSREDPLGERAEALHRWMFDEPEENRAEIDAIVDAGAFIMGRNMFGPIRGDWDEEWHGWWGDDPPYHAPVFVLTHYPKPTLEMEGGTSFTFVTDGIDSALAQAREAAGERNVAIAGGAETVRQYLNAGAIDELRLHVAPVLLGAGERLLDDVGGIGLETVSVRGNSLVTHMAYRVVGGS